MKRIMILLLILVVGVVAFAQTAIVTSNPTVGWQAVTKLSDGTVVPTGDIISYDVVISPYVSGQAPVPTFLANVSSLNYHVTFSGEGQYVVGVRTKRVVSDGTVMYSDYVWSSVGGTPSPFGLCITKVRWSQAVLLTSRYWVVSRRGHAL
jgi:hypothetical protein